MTMLGIEQTWATCAAALTSRPSAARLRLNVWLHCRQKHPFASKLFTIPLLFAVCFFILSERRLLSRPDKSRSTKSIITHVGSYFFAERDNGPRNCSERKAETAEFSLCGLSLRILFISVCPARTTRSLPQSTVTAQTMDFSGKFSTFSTICIVTFLHLSKKQKMNSSNSF